MFERLLMRGDHRRDRTIVKIEVRSAKASRQMCLQKAVEVASGPHYRVKHRDALRDRFGVDACGLGVPRLVLGMLGHRCGNQFAQNVNDAGCSQRGKGWVNERIGQVQACPVAPAA